MSVIVGTDTAIVVVVLVVVTAHAFKIFPPVVPVSFTHSLTHFVFSICFESVRLLEITTPKWYLFQTTRILHPFVVCNI